jgi:glycosyltransferase involved in cell wall biosynthesis
MTAYNRQDFIAEAIESVLTSTYPHFELIIVDDGSKDDTVSIAQFYAAKDNRIKLYINEQNLGDYRNRNKAASLAHGKYLKYVDSDDMIMPWCLEVMVFCMEQYPEIPLGLSTNIFQNIKYPQILTPSDAYRAYYYKNQVLSVGPTAAIIRRTEFEQIGGFSGENYLGDTDLWFRLIQNAPVLFLPPNLVYWREHQGQQIVQERKNNLIELKRFEFDKKMLGSDQAPLSKEECKKIIRNLKNIKTRNALLSFVKGKPIEAIRKMKTFKIGIIDIIMSLRHNTNITAIKKH